MICYTTLAWNIIIKARCNSARERGNGLGARATPTIQITEEDNKAKVTVTLVIENAEITPQMRELLGKVSDHGLRMTSRIVEELIRRGAASEDYCEKVARMLPEDDSILDALDRVS